MSDIVAIFTVPINMKFSAPRYPSNKTTNVKTLCIFANDLFSNCKLMHCNKKLFSLQDLFA